MYVKCRISLYKHLIKNSLWQINTRASIWINTVHDYNMTQLHNYIIIIIYICLLTKGRKDTSHGKDTNATQKQNSKNLFQVTIHKI